MTGYVILVKHGSEWGNRWSPDKRLVMSINTDANIVNRCRKLMEDKTRVFFHVVGDSKIRTSALIQSVSPKDEKKILYVTFTDHIELVSPVDVIPQQQGARSYDHSNLNL